MVNKFFGNVGYSETVNKGHSVYETVIVERPYYGDVLTASSKRFYTAEKTNDEIVLKDRISIIADPYALNHYSAIKYVVRDGVKWIVNDVSVNYPRLILSLGGVYHEQED